MWFERLTGFRESGREQVIGSLREDGPFLVSAVNGRRMRRGHFAVVGLDVLRKVRDQAGPVPGADVGAARATRVREVVGDVRDLHADPASAGAVFQVASQFNMLEMADPRVTPDDGIDCYETDHTQGPACAIACGAGTIHRNYLVPFGSGPHVPRGQTADRQLDGFADLAAALDLAVDMRNGYAFLTPPQLDRAAARLDGLTGPQRDDLAGRLRVGVQSDAEVTWKDAGHTVTQVFCSALPIAYAGGDLARWEPLARLVLDAAYEATLAAAVPAAVRTGNRTVYLTLLGAGAFGNPVEWVVDALRRAVRLHRGSGLDIRVVSYGQRRQELRTLTDPEPPASCLPTVWVQDVARVKAPEVRPCAAGGAVHQIPSTVSKIATETTTSTEAGAPRATGAFCIPATLHTLRSGGTWHFMGGRRPRRTNRQRSAQPNIPRPGPRA